MGRYYYGDIEGKFMFAVQSSDAGERFGAYETPQEPTSIDYAVSKDSYDKLSKELKMIELSGSVTRVEHMWAELEKEGRMGYSQEDCVRFNVTPHDLSEYADWQMGKKMKDYFDDNPEAKSLWFNAEL
tara:strand:- start:436 stop:819 length:384 start_codon:yes stop_codon:yes gene_type:complete